MAHTKKQPVGRITSGIGQSALALKTISFVRQQLTTWRDDSDRPDEQSEDRLNLQLCKFLNSRARTDFPMVRFDREEYQFESRRIDLAASPVETMIIGVKLHTIYDPYLVLEGKRLPAPSSSREKEYVTGYEKRTGGIQRLKLRLHGGKHDIAVMIGYVQMHSFGSWHRKINGWIAELASGAIADVCIWKGNETLGVLEEDASMGIASCRSLHSRTGRESNNEIRIHHFWIAMNVRSAA